MQTFILSDCVRMIYYKYLTNYNVCSLPKALTYKPKLALPAEEVLKLRTPKVHSCAFERCFFEVENDKIMLKAIKDYR